ncbi:PadR family transcriptional regulator [Bowmanella sp. Y26]|uniref:PadR family transcriptional regulator n=1 Tax=Bowmanella yangjiangensis TaxID=2811230 RepID=UPI001BDC0F81|nr:PadR family transcriptional regulator [Bowmanella yangjiangensis]MBT1062495.1 PadR family transcriptional regulator [Bowmanella yangjiangensis]
MNKLTDVIAKWEAQLRKGTLELAILAALDNQTRYGLELLNFLHGYPSLVITEGTLYPLLDRLKRDGVISAYWQQEGDTRPRKYFTLTDLGRQKLTLLNERWQQSMQDINQILTK